MEGSLTVIAEEKESGDEVEYYGPFELRRKEYRFGSKECTMLHGGNWKRQKMLNPKRENQGNIRRKCSLQFLLRHDGNAWSKERKCKGSIWRYVPALWDKWSVSADNAIFGAANGSLPDCRRTIRSYLLNVPLRFMTAGLSEKNRTIPTSLPMQRMRLTAVGNSSMDKRQHG